MASEKEFRVRRGLVVANTVLVTNGQNVGIGNTAPLEKFRVEGAASVAGNLAIAGVSTINATGVYHPFGTLSGANVSVSDVFTVNVYATSKVNAASHTSGPNYTANTSGVYHTGIVNSATLAVGNASFGLSVNSATLSHTGNVSISNTLSVGNTANKLTANSTGVYHTGLVNSATLAVGNTANGLSVNSTGAYHTGLVNSATLAVGNTANGLSVNSTGAYHTGIINSASVNSTSYNIGTTLIANTTGVYHTGLVNSSTLSIGNSSSTLSVNSVGAYHTGLVNSATLSVGNSTSTLSVNSVGAYHTGLVNSATLAVGNVAFGLSVNSTGSYHTGIVNSATLAVGNASFGLTVNSALLSHTGNTSLSNTLLVGNTANKLTVNSTGSYHTGITNSATLAVGNAAFGLFSNSGVVTHTGNATISNTFYAGNTANGMTINSTGAYHTGLVNASSFVVNTGTSTTFIANNTGLYHTGIVNANGYYVGSNINLTQAGLSLTTNSSVFTVINSTSIQTPALLVNGSITACGDFTVGGNLVTTGTSQSAGNLVPANTAVPTYNLGTPTPNTRWLSVYSANADLTTFLSVGNTSVNTQISPTVVNASIANTANINQVLSFATILANGSISLSNVTSNLIISVANTTQYASANVFLRANGSWGDISTTVGGTNTSILFNDSGVINGDSGLLYDKSTDNLSVANNILVTTSVNASSFTATNLVANSTTIALGTATINSSAYVLLASGNSTVNSFANIFTNAINLTTSSNVGNVATFTNVVSGAITLSSNVAAPNNVSINTTSIVIGNNSISTTINATSFTGTSANATLLNNQLGSYYQNATNMNTGTLPDARLSSAIVNTSATFTLAANHTYSNAYVLISSGNSTVNSYANIFTNALSLSTSSNVGNITTFTNVVSGTITLSSNATTPNSISINATSIVVGNSSVNTTVNSTYFTGTSANAATLNNQSASYYTNATNINTGTLPDAQLSSAIVNTSGNFTLGGNLTLNGNVDLVGTNNYFSSGFAINSISTTSNGVVANSSTITIGNSTVNVSINSTAFSGSIGTFGGQVASYYTNATNMNTGTLPDARLSSAVVNTSGNFTFGGNLVVNGTSLTFSNSTSLIAKGSAGSNGQVLGSNGSGIYWTTPASSSKIYKKFTATDGQIVFDTQQDISGINAGIDVYYNGVHLSNTDDYSISGNNILLVYGANSGSIIEVSGWSTLYGALTAVDSSLSYVWDSTQKFKANLNIGITNTGNIVATNTSIIFNTNTTANSTINTTNYTGTSNNSVYLNGVPSANYFQITDSKTLSGNLYFTGANNIFVSNLDIGTGSANVILASNLITFNGTTTGTINATNYSGTAANATNLGGVPSANYVQFSDTRTLSGSLYFTGANNTFGNQFTVGNSVVNTVISQTSITFASNVAGSNGTLSATNYTGTANNANYLGGAAANVYVNTSSNFTLGGTLTSGSTQANIVFGSSNITFNSNASVNATINTTNYTGTSNNALYLFGYGANNFLTNTGNYTLGGNITFAANLISTSRLSITGALQANGNTGGAGQALLSNGSGYVYWGAAPATAGGGDTAVQFNDGGSTVNGYSTFTFNKSTATVTVNAITVNAITTNTISSAGTLTLSQPVSLSNTLTVANNVSISGVTNVNAVLNVNNNLTVNGSIALKGSTGTAGYVLASNGTNSPVWAPYPSGGMLFGSVTFTPPTVSGRNIASIDITVSGITTNHKILSMVMTANVTGSLMTAGMKLVQSYPSAVNTIRFVFENDSTGSITDPAYTVTYLAWV